MAMSWRMRSEMQRWQRDVPRPQRDSEIYESDEQFDEDMRTWQECYDAKVAKLRRAEFDDAIFAAQKKAVQDAEAARIRQSVNDGNIDIPELAEIMSKLKNRNGNGGNIHEYYFVTVNPKPDVLLSELKCKVEKYVKRKFIKSAEYVYEQRGSHDGERGKGMHAHILVRQVGTKFDGEFKRDSRNTFKMLVGNPATHVDIRTVAAAHLSDKRDYMRGLKTGEGKAEKTLVDRVWRRENNLEHYYTQFNGAQVSEEKDSEEAADATADAPSDDDDDTTGSVSDVVC